MENNTAEFEIEVEDLGDFIENAPLPMHWVNGSGVIIWANQFELDMLGYNRDEYLGEHISKFHFHKDAIEEILTRLIHRETLMNFPAELICKDGSIKKVLINSNVYWKDGKFMHTRCFTSDISNTPDLYTKF